MVERVADLCYFSYTLLCEPLGNLDKPERNCSKIWLSADLCACLSLQKTKLEVRTPNVIRNIVPMKLDEVQPPDHVDGLRMEQDGQLNRDYKKEIIIGNHEEFEQPGSDKKLVARLKIIFLR